MPPIVLQPLSGTDMAAFVLIVLAGLYAALWLRDREPGMSWLTASYALLALWYASSDLHMPSGLYVVGMSRFWASVVLVSTMLMSVALVDYLGTPARLRRFALIGLLAPGMLLLACFATGVPVHRGLGNAAGLLCYVGTAALAFRAARREPGAGHGVLGAALLAVPVTLAALLLRGGELSLLRFYVVLPAILFGMTLLTVSLLRRRRALEAEVGRRTAAETELTRLNAELEHAVAARTADLQNMVAGLESFNRSVSHDLRGPLGGIEGLARLSLEALERGDADVARRVLPAIASQAQTSGRLVAALLELARVGDATLQRDDVDLAALVRDSIGQLSLHHALPRITIGELPTVHADRDLLRPVFINLIGNALKFGGAGADAHVQIAASANDEEFVVCVRDNGIGFPAGVAERLFVPFTRLHGAAYEGHGVGLSIVRRAIERHGGRAWAEAAPQQGAAFYFTLPRRA
jgi:signal transduction histidine kinase